jgi:D-beta-D-heptose 7-phosphate kinase/D-beta-D-heptose 1-phosphate adenosyltransferase
MSETLSRLIGGNPTILVVGDLILDRYVWGEVERISPEAPVQVLRWESENDALGGAANVARNLAALGCNVRLLGFIGDDGEAARFERLAGDAGIDGSHIQRLPGRPTVSKTRFIARSQHVLRVDKEENSPLPSQAEGLLLDALPAALEGVDGVICSDYLKGAISPIFMKGLLVSTKERDISIVVDTKGNDYSKYRGVRAITPNLAEVFYATGVDLNKAAPQADREHALDKAVRALFDQVDPEFILITRGPDGMTLFKRGQRIAHETAHALDVYDVTGAGDTAAALFSLALFQGIPPEEATRVANLGSCIVVGKVGTATVTVAEIESALTGNRSETADKIFGAEELALRLQHERAKGRKVVFTNGCFDLLHVGHIQYLQQARTLGDLLIVGLNDDESVRRIKGEGRPLIEETQRGLLLGALACVDYVVFFPEDTPENLLQTIRPDILVKGGDYTPDEVVGKNLVESLGGRVEVLPFVEGVSTTDIVNTILERYSGD